jgi:histidinol-phosphate aminotransferase
MVDHLIRPHLLTFLPYSSARDEFHGEAKIWLDANENPHSPLDSTLCRDEAHINRYPDPHHRRIKNILSQQKGIAPEHIVIGNGSDELVDLLIRLVGEPSHDAILIHPPTYGMYSVVAKAHNVGVLSAPLLPNFQLNRSKMLEAFVEKPKVTFLCSPNNPSGNCLIEEDIQWVLSHAPGLVVIDEAYIDFCPSRSLLSELSVHPHLLVMQTFSKAWGCAGLRAGVLYGPPRIIDLLHRIKPPYNVNVLTQRVIEQILLRPEVKDSHVATLTRERDRLIAALSEVPCIGEIFPSDANFILAECQTRDETYYHLLQSGIVVRKPSVSFPALRFSLGSSEENSALIEALMKFH